MNIVIPIKLNVDGKGTIKVEQKMYRCEHYKTCDHSECSHYYLHCRIKDNNGYGCNQYKRKPGNEKVCHVLSKVVYCRGVN